MEGFIHRIKTIIIIIISVMIDYFQLFVEEEDNKAPARVRKFALNDTPLQIIFANSN